MLSSSLIRYFFLGGRRLYRSSTTTLDVSKILGWLAGFANLNNSVEV